MGCQLITLLALKISSASCLYRLLRYQQAHSDIVWHRTLNAMIETVSNTNNNRLIGFVSNYRYISNILTSKLLNNMNNMIFFCFVFLQKRTPLNYILLNLAMSDVCIAGFGAPMSAAAAVAREWPFGEAVCLGYALLMSVTGQSFLFVNN